MSIKLWDLIDVKIILWLNHVDLEYAKAEEN